MIKNFTLFLLLFTCFTIEVSAQCTTNLSFATATFFDPASITGCTNGTSCSGSPTNYDNRAACEPTTALDACAPAPSCGTLANNASDLWFKFYATGTTATINTNPSVSMITAIQAFSGGPGCGSLLEIGCAVAAGVSTGVAVNLTGLTPGDLYYFRVYGSANGPSQRTGTFCFCGTTGLTNVALAIHLTNFSAAAHNKNVLLKWSIATGSDAKSFEIERSTDGVNFTTVSTIPVSGSTYEFTDKPSVNRIVLYRLKSLSIDNRIEHSKIIPVNLSSNASLTVYPTLAKGSTLDVETTDAVNINIINASGAILATHNLSIGHNQVDISKLHNGVFYLRNTKNGEMVKFVIHR